jgi:16S rRNA (uracil1498-N3)-methyltransferase
LKLTDFQHFYVDPNNVHGDSLSIVGDEFHHAAKVLRKKEGDTLVAVNGKGVVYTGVVERLEKNALSLHITSREFGVGEPCLRLIVAQSMPKGSHFDLVVEKGTEIGVSVFQPMISERSIIDPESRTERWRHKALTAMKQCGRSVCPEIRRTQPFMELLQEPLAEIKFIAHEDVIEENSASWEGLRTAGSAVVFIGPEGGFSDSEFQTAVEFGATPISLGPRRLRSETAALVAAVKILSFVGDL